MIDGIPNRPVYFCQKDIIAGKLKDVPTLAGKSQTAAVPRDELMKTHGFLRAALQLAAGFKDVREDVPGSAKEGWKRDEDPVNTYKTRILKLPSGSRN